MRINKYLALKKYCTRREADDLIRAGTVLINGRTAKLGEKVTQNDHVEVTRVPRTFRYVAYHKPRGVVTHSPQGDERDIAGDSGLTGLFPIGRLDKDSSGLILLTDDGRLTDPLLHPDREHEKEYVVSTLHALPYDFKEKMERGVDIGSYTTKPCTLSIRGPMTFSIVLTEGKKHQIRRMCGHFGQSAQKLMRTRIMNIRLGSMPAGAHRTIEGEELKTLLASLGLLSRD